MKVDLNEIVKKLPAYIFLLNKQEEICYINRVAHYEALDAILGISLLDIFIQSEEYNKVSTQLKEVFTTGKSTSLEIEINNKRWPRMWFTTHLIPYGVKEDGSFEYVLGVNYDNSQLIEEKINSRLNAQKFQYILEGTPTNVMLLDKSFTIIFYNKMKEKPEVGSAILGKSVFNFTPHKHHERLKSIYQKVLQTGKEESYEIEGYHPVDGVKWYKGKCGVIKEGEVVDCLIVQTYNITARKLEEMKIKEFNQKLESLVEERTAELQRANKEIKVLLNEMHHRVKNNFQIISSLLNIQTRFVDPSLQKVLLQSQDRIYSMSLIHEMLYKNNSLSEISINEYINTLIINQLQMSHSSIDIKSIVDIRTKKQSFSIDRMVPIGLLLNELITNSIKHAFEGIDQPSISIVMSDIQRGKLPCIQMNYIDNGVGLHHNSKNTSTLGKELIGCFVEQLDAKYTIITGQKGVNYEFIIPDQ